MTHENQFTRYAFVHLVNVIIVCVNGIADGQRFSTHIILHKVHII